MSEMMCKLQRLQKSVNDYIEFVNNVDSIIEEDKREYEEMKNELVQLKIDADKFISDRFENGVTK